MALQRFLVGHAVMGAVMLSAATLLVRSCRAPNRIQAAAERFLAEAPEILLVGNSLLRVGVDEAALEARLGRTAFKLTSDGSGTAFWYLVAKNLVPAAKPPPRAQVMLFHTTELTDPLVDFEGGIPTDLEALSGPAEPLLMERAYVPAMGRFLATAYRHSSLVRGRRTAREETERRFRNDWIAPLIGVTGREVNLAFVNVLGDRKMRRDLIDQYQAGRRTSSLERFRFPERLARSLLPALVDELRAHAVVPVFVRQRSLAQARGVAASPELAGYLRALESWLAEHGAELIDLSGTEAIGPEQFMAGDHLSPDGALRITALVAERLDTILTAPPPRAP